MKRLWLVTAALLTLAVASSGGVFAYYYLDEEVGPRAVALLYHRLVTAHQFAACTGEDRYYAIPIDRFEQHLRYLKDHGYRSLSTDECIAFLKGRRGVPDRSVLITIDDGYVSALTFAQPLLRKYGFRATLFVTADPRATIFNRGSPRQRRLTDDELRRLDPNVIDVHAHGLTHRSLDELSDDDLQVELIASRLALEQTLGRPVRYMAVPGNHYDQRVLEFAKEAGYEAVFSSDPGSVDPDDGPLGLPRVNVAGYVDPSGLATLLDPEGMARRRFFRAIAQGPQHILGVTLGSPISQALYGHFAAHPPSHQTLFAALVCITAMWAAPPLAVGGSRWFRFRRAARLMAIPQQVAKTQ